LRREHLDRGEERSTVKTVLVGVDGSRASSLALLWAAGLARGLGIEKLVIATVYVADPLDNQGWDDAHTRAGERLEDWCGPARNVGVSYEPVVLDGESGPALLAAATDRTAELTVVSRRGCGGFDALAAGSTADYLAHHTRRPLAVVPPQGATSPPTHVLVALDGSAGATAAATWAAAAAATLHARVSAAYVPAVPEIFGRLTRHQRAQAEEALTGHWVLALRDAGLAPECHVVDSIHPADALMELAEDGGADLIIAGSRAVGGLRRIRLGGVTMALLHHSDVPVIAVPPEP
jgi:nucleotide-binding universal stress UspA family protein